MISDIFLAVAMTERKDGIEDAKMTGPMEECKRMAAVIGLVRVSPRSLEQASDCVMEMSCEAASRLR